MLWAQVENPIPFADGLKTRLLSIAHLHAKYASLLVLPLELSADWSFDCVPLVERLADPRNCLSLTLYLALALVVMLARPWELLAETFLGRPRAAGRSEQEEEGGFAAALVLEQVTARPEIAKPSLWKVVSLTSTFCFSLS